MRHLGLKGAAALAAASMAFAVAACGDSDEKSSSSGAATTGTTAAAAKPASVKGKTIGVSMHFLADDYAKDFSSTVKSDLEAKGAKVILSSADGDPGKQLSDIQSMTTRRVDAMIVIPIDESAIVPAIKIAKKANIPVLSASPIPAVDKELTAIVGPSDFGNGEAACKEMAAKIDTPGAEVAISTASVTLYRIDQRVAGCKKALDAANLKVVDTAKGLSPEEGLKNAQNLISAHPKLRGIFGSFSNLVLGAGNAVKQAGRKDVAVSGIDADRAIIKQIASGNVTDVAAQFPSQQAKLIAAATATVVGGGTVEHDQQDQLPTRTVDSTNYEDRYQEIWGEPYPTG